MSRDEVIWIYIIGSLIACATPFVLAGCYYIYDCIKHKTIL